MILPKRFHSLFFQQGISWLGLKSGVAGFLAVLFSLGLYFSFPVKKEVVPIPEKPPVEQPKELTNSLGMTFRLIPAGDFLMGSPEDEPGRIVNETQHEVTLTESFYMQSTEVTQEQWVSIMGDNPSSFKDCDKCPVETVYWEEVQKFLEKINKREGINLYRLPTEEYCLFSNM